MLWLPVNNRDAINRSQKRQLLGSLGKDMMNYDMDMLTRIQRAYVSLAVRNTSMDSAQLWAQGHLFLEEEDEEEAAEIAEEDRSGEEEEKGGKGSIVKNYCLDIVMSLDFILNIEQ